MASGISWRRIALPAYGPTVLVSLGTGAVMPLVALTARDLGASVGLAALVVALVGIGQLVGDLPAGALAARIGEKHALLAAALVDAAALLLAFFADSVLVLGLAVFVLGVSSAVFGLARQAYFTEAVPPHQRARAMSTLGGVFRFGSFVGPFVGAALVAAFSINAAYAFAGLMSLAAAVLIGFLPDLPGGPDRTAVTEHPSVLSVLAHHRRVLLTLGTGVLLISAIRSTRQTIVPLWADANGISPATTAVIFGIAAGIDMLLFFPGGMIMDRFGRAYVAVPAMIVIGLGLVLLPLTSTAAGIALVASVMGLGNGISAGIVMTLGADTAPAAGRSQYLGGWRLCADTGNALGPLAIGAVTLVAPLAVAALGLGAAAWAGAAWLARWIGEFAPAPSHLVRD